MALFYHPSVNSYDFESQFPYLIDKDELQIKGKLGYFL